MDGDARAPSESPPDAREPIDLLVRDLRSRREGLSDREAARRLITDGPNELRRTHRRGWTAALVRQLTHPLAMLLWIAAGLALGSGLGVVAAAVVAVIVLNGAFALIQERHAERAVEALAEYLPQHATVVRSGRRRQIDARSVVRGDVLIVAAGDRICADARLLEGGVQIDMSAVSGESAPVTRAAGRPDTGGSLIDCPQMIFSGTTCTAGAARGLVVATGMRSELGRIAALSQRPGRETSPLEREVRRVAWIIAAVAVAIAVAFIPLGTLLAGLPVRDAVSFAIGLLIGNVPEGLLPTITLALALGVGVLARRGALVKRLSAVETLGAATVICTDKTGTLTQNSHRVVRLWTPQTGDVDAPWAVGPAGLTASTRRLVTAAAVCTEARLPDADHDEAGGDPMEVALLQAASALGLDVDPDARDGARRQVFAFDPELRRMSTIDGQGGELVVHTKGAPESVLPLCTTIGRDAAHEALIDAGAAAFRAAVDRAASEGFRVLAVATRPAPPGDALDRGAAERDLTLLGFVAAVDPPRPEVAEAVARCRSAGIRVIVVTGDHGLTAKALGRRIGLTSADVRVVTGDQLAGMNDDQLDVLLGGAEDVLFARSAPEAKLRITDALRAAGHVVAMTGDGVNDAPALRHADIGIAMGRSGTDVAREAATMVLTDDNFASIVAAVEEGRRVFDNIRKFVLYIFAHATPEVAPFLLYALSGGAIPLPLTALQILAIDLGTETVPALALGREPAEAGIMTRRPRQRGDGLIGRAMLFRAWVFLGLISAALVIGGFLAVLVSGGWRPGDPTGPGMPLHDTYRQATTMTFLGIVACQFGTGLAARTEHASLRSVGLFTNPLLLWGFAFEAAFVALLIGVPAIGDPLGLDRPPWQAMLVLPAFAAVVWGADEVRRMRRRAAVPAPP